jgi:hypothetical protein
VSGATYLIGAVVFAAGVGALVRGAWILRVRLLPDWSGAPARLAEVVIGLGAAIAIAEVLGTVALFRWWAVYAGFAGFGVVVQLVWGRDRGERRATAAAPSLRRAECTVAVFGAVLVLGQWTTQVVDTFRRGMTHADTVWYHGPHTVRFLQDGRITQLLGPRRAIETYYAANSELVHAIVNLPFHRDLLSPLVSLGAVAIALLAGWCIGRDRGVAPTCMLAVAMVLALPVMAGSQAGQAGNDLPAAALLLVAVALVLREPDRPAVLALAGIAGGLAVGTKPTVAVALVVATLGLVWVAWRTRRVAPLAAWAGAAVLAGGYWYTKNLVTVGNPQPGVTIGVGDVALPLVTPKNGCCPASRFLTDGAAWRDTFLPGLADALTNLWPLVVGLALLGGILTAVQGRGAVERMVGAGAIAAAVGYVFTPLTAAGVNLGLFTINLRYLTPALFLGCVLLPRTRLFATGDRWWWCAAAFLAALVAGYVADHYEHAPAWPLDNAFGIVLVLAAVAGILTFLALGASPARPRLTSTGRVVLVAGAVLVIVAIGWPVQRAYFDDRYRTVASPVDAYGPRFNDVSDRRVAIFGSAVQYLLAGHDLSNVVRQADAPAWPERAAPTERAKQLERCRSWRTQLRDDAYDYIVLVNATFYFGPNPEPWVTSDPAADVVAATPDYRVVRVRGELDPGDCPRVVGATARDQAGGSGTPST